MLDEFVKEANRIKLETVAKGLEKRCINAFYADNIEEAKKIAMSFIKAGDIVSSGGSMTVSELGLREEIEKQGIEFVDSFAGNDDEEKRQQRLKALGSDVYFMSSNAITMDGVLVNIDGTGNRMAALCYGPRQVVLIVGANKVAADEEAALKRIRTDACPPNCVRLGKKTPCAVTGKCGECLSLGNTSCCMIVTTRFCSTGRLNVILVNEELGY